MFYIRHNVQELEYVLSQPFARFWAHMTHPKSQVITFMDTFIANMRRVNDTYKLQLEALGNSASKKKS